LAAKKTYEITLEKTVLMKTGLYTYSTMNMKYN